MDIIYHDAILKIKDHIEKYIKDKEENLEIEFRLGFKENDSFKTDIGKTFFNKMISKMNDSDTCKKNESSDDYFYKGKRLSVLKESNKKESKCIKKTKLAVFDFTFKGTAFDIRVSISTETPVNRFQPDKAEYKRSKDRNSFEYKNWRYDFTTVSIVENTIETKSYEVELESIKPDLSKTSSYYFCHDAFLKLTDLIKMCDPIEEDPKIVFVSEKIF